MQKIEIETELLASKIFAERELLQPDISGQIYSVTESDRAEGFSIETCNEATGELSGTYFLVDYTYEGNALVHVGNERQKRFSIRLSPKFETSPEGLYCYFGEGIFLKKGMSCSVDKKDSLLIITISEP